MERNSPLEFHLFLAVEVPDWGLLGVVVSFDMVFPEETQFIGFSASALTEVTGCLC